jgi:aspartyl protease family protein
MSFRGIVLASALIGLAAPAATAQTSTTPGATPGVTPGAPQIALAGRMGDKALLLMGGRTVVLGLGQASGGTKLLRWDDEAAVVEHGGAQLRLRVGAAPATLGNAAPAATRGREIVIPVGPGGHFMTDGSINGQTVRFMVDTGATLVALSMADARRIGLDLRDARRVITQTAGGAVPSLMLPLQRVRVGDVEIYNVMAVVSETPMPFVLLGNSFLDRFQWRRENDVMRLERK